MSNNRYQYSIQYLFLQNPKPLLPGWDQFPYEYNSVMHYPELTGKDGRKVMEPLKPGVTLGNDVSMTQVSSLKCQEIILFSYPNLL